MMPVKDVVNLSPGAIIELPKLADEELEILVNNKPIGTGRAVKVGENFGIHVNYVGDIKSRIAALGAASAGVAANVGDSATTAAAAVSPDADAAPAGEAVLASQA